MSYEKNNSKSESDIKQFAILPRAVLSANISTTARVVYAQIASYYWGAESAIYPAYSTIAEAVGLSRRTVIRAVNELVAAGFLTKNNRTKETGATTTNEYFLYGDKNDNRAGDKNDNRAGDKNDNRAGDKNDNPNKTNNLNKNINLKIYNTRARGARAKNAAAAAQRAAEMALNSQDIQLYNIYKQAKGSNWYELLRINQTYCLRPYSKHAFSAVSNVDYNNLVKLIEENAGSCRPLEVGNHFDNEVKINV